MPKVTLTTRQCRANALAGLIIGSMRECGVTHGGTGKHAPLERRRIFQNFQKGGITYDTASSVAGA